MPHEKINHPTHGKQVVVAWGKAGWTQISIYPDGWSHTGDAEHVDLSEPELDKLIATLKRAKRQAYSGARLAGFEDREPFPDGSNLFNASRT